MDTYTNRRTLASYESRVRGISAGRRRPLSVHRRHGSMRRWPIYQETLRSSNLEAGKFRAALKPGGRLAISLKQGNGEEWSDAKLGAPRYFCYRQPDQLGPALRAAGFADWTVEEAVTDRAHAEWLYIIAKA